MEQKNEDLNVIRVIRKAIEIERIKKKSEEKEAHTEEKEQRNDGEPPGTPEEDGVPDDRRDELAQKMTRRKRKDQRNGNTNL